MRTDMDIKINGVDFQRNGIGGDPFYQVFFTYKERGMIPIDLIAVLTDQKTQCFVIDPKEIQNHWRGDRFEKELRMAIINHYAKKYDRTYEEEQKILNNDSKDKAW